MNVLAPITYIASEELTIPAWWIYMLGGTIARLVKQSNR
jgi:hypothetical protein